MPEQGSILNGEPISLKQAKLGTWDGDGSYSDVTAAYGSVNLEVSAAMISAQRFGDGGALLASYGRKTSGTGTFEFATADFTTLAKILGFEIEEYGSTPDKIRAIRMYNTGIPYFGLVAAFDLDSGLQNGVHFFAPKAQVTSDSITFLSGGGGQEAEFRTTSVDVTFLPDDNYAEGGLNEEVLMTLGTPTQGTFTISLGSYTTAPIAYNAAASVIEDAIEALPPVGAGNVSVTVATPSGFDVAFIGELAGQRLPLITGEGSTSPAWGGTFTATRTARGTEANNLIFAAYEVEGGYSLMLPPLFPV